MKKAVIYCRVSTEEQVGNLSLSTQESMCHEYCTRNEYEVATVFVEEGESAKTADRPKFQAMQEYCRRHKAEIDLVVVHSLSRFSRNLDDHVLVAATLRRLGIKLRSVTEPFDETPTGRLLETVIAGLAEFDNRTKSGRTISGMKKAIEIGRWTHMAPLGYLNQMDASEQPIIVKDQERADLVNQGFEMFATGLYTQKQVLQKLTQLGLRTRKGNRVAPQSFQQMLKNPFYTGWIQLKKWGIRQQGNFPALVSEDVFNRVQAVLTGRRPSVTPQRRNREDFPLRRFAKCGNCGAVMTSGWSTGRTRKYPYYKCSKNCRGMGIRSEKLEANFLTEMERLRVKPEVAALFSAVVGDFWKRQTSQMRDIAASLERRAKELEGRRQRVIEAFLFKQAIDEATYQAQLARIDAESREVATQRSAVDGDNGLDVAAVADFAARLLENPAQAWQSMSLDQRQRFQAVLFPNGMTVLPGGAVRTDATLPVFNVLEKMTSAESGQGPHTVATWNRVMTWLREIDVLRQVMSELGRAA